MCTAYSNIGCFCLCKCFACCKFLTLRISCICWQVCFFSATLHSPQITELAAQICVNPAWADLKGTDAVPDTVHHVLYRVDPVRDVSYCQQSAHGAVTDGMHAAGGGAGGSGNERNSQQYFMREYVHS